MLGIIQRTHNYHLIGLWEHILWSSVIYNLHSLVLTETLYKNTTSFRTPGSVLDNYFAKPHIFPEITINPIILKLTDVAIMSKHDNAFKGQ